MLNSIPQHDQDLFKQTVLQHITTKLPTEEWELFRYHWCMVNQRMDPDAEPNPDLTPNQLVNEALTSMRNEVEHLPQLPVRLVTMGYNDGYRQPTAKAPAQTRKAACAALLASVHSFTAP